MGLYYGTREGSYLKRGLRLTALISTLVSLFSIASFSGGCANDNAKTAASTSTGTSTLANSSVTSGLALTGAAQTVAPYGTVRFTATGGAAPYTYRVISGGGDITSGGIYTAPSSNTSVEVGVFDSLGTWAYAFVTVTSTTTQTYLSLATSVQTITPNGAVQLTASGGTQPYTYSVASGGGTISNPNIGSYTAPASATSVQLAVQDATGTRAYAWVTVSGASTPLSATAETPSIVGGATTRVIATGGTGSYTYYVYSGGGTISTAGLYQSLSSASASTAQIVVQDSGGTSVVVSVTVTSSVSCTGSYTINQYSSRTSYTGTMNITQYASGYFTGTMYFAGSGLGYGSTAISGNCYSNGTIAFTRMGPFGGAGGTTYSTQAFSGNFYQTTGSQVAMYGSFTAQYETLTWSATPR